MADEHAQQPGADPSARFEGDDGPDLIVAALDHLGRSLSPDGSPHWKEDAARQKTCLREWAESLGLLLNAEEIFVSIMSLDELTAEIDTWSGDERALAAD